MFLLVIGSFGDDVTLSVRTRIIYSRVASFSPKTQRGIAWYCANRMRVLLKRQGFLFVCLTEYSRNCSFQVAEKFLAQVFNTCGPSIVLNSFGGQKRKPYSSFQNNAIS